MRTSHATSELCPPPAVSADIARRRLLTAVAAAPVIAVAFPASAERRSDNGDADYLAAFAAKLADRERNVEEDTPEEVAASWRLHDYLADTLVVTLPGAVAKLAFAADQAFDHLQINNPHESLPRALTSLRASLPGLPESVAAAPAFAAAAIESNTRDYDRAAMALSRSERDAAKWKEIDDIFERTGANAMIEERRRHHARHDLAAEDAGEPSITEKFVRIVAKLDKSAVRMFGDKILLMGLADKTMHAMEHLGRADQIGSDSVADTMRSIARDFTAAADRLASPAQPVALADHERLTAHA